VLLAPVTAELIAGLLAAGGDDAPAHAATRAAGERALAMPDADARERLLSACSPLRFSGAGERAGGHALAGVRS